MYRKNSKNYKIKVTFEQEKRMKMFSKEPKETIIGKRNLDNECLREINRRKKIQKMKRQK